MKRLLTALLIGLCFGMSMLSMTASVANAGGDDSVYPLDFPLPFPWDGIEGYWAIESNTFKAVFRFEKQEDCGGNRTLKIWEINPRTNEIISKGLGTYWEQESMQVNAAMARINGRMVYRLKVGAYKDTKSIPEKTVYGLRIASFDGQRIEDYRIVRIGDLYSQEPANDNVRACLRR